MEGCDVAFVHSLCAQCAQCTHIVVSCVLQLPLNFVYTSPWLCKIVLNILSHGCVSCWCRCFFYAHRRGLARPTEFLL